MSIVKWLKESHRWQHFAGGIVIGFGANSIYCAAYAGIGVASAMEFKDWQDKGSRPELADFLLTVAGVAVGYGIRLAVASILK